jgi:hypothetical protein
MVREPERMRPLQRHRPGLVDNIKIDVREVGWEGMDWFYLAFYYER